MVRDTGVIRALRPILLAPIVSAAILLAGAMLPGHATAQDAALNSTRKIRPEPSAQAARCGSAVAWRDSVAAARAEAAESGRPVFWYVPTVPRSRMDRKPEIDRYMLAGPFSWPAVVEVLNGAFVPVRAVPDRELAAALDLVPVAFVEPGFVVLDPAAGEPRVLARHDELTTLAPDWFVARLVDALPEAARDAARALAARPTDAAAGAWAGVDRLDAALKAHRAGDPAGMRAALEALAAEHPDAPLGAKAAAELEGHGPLVRGFEVFDDLPDAVLARPGVRGTRAPSGVYDEAAMRSAALRMFSAMQGETGGFEDSRYDFGGTDSLPNVHVAVTALVALALLEIASDFDGAARDRLEATLAAAFDYATDDARLNPVDRDELIWAHLYRCRLASRWLVLRPDDEARIRPRLEAAVAAIVAMQDESGAWYHEYPNPFVSGSCLVALGEAQDLGVAVPETVVDNGVRALLQCRAEDGAISYGQTRRGPPRARVAGGVGRMPLAEHALALWGRGAQERLGAALDASFEHEEELFEVRKYDDHASRNGYGGFFFWYDLHVRTEALGRLDDADRRAALLARQRARILELVEIDGCFVDSHELGRVYGTAMAMICLARSRTDR